MKDLALYKNNSTFNPEILRDDSLMYGDNVYIQQIMALKRNESKVNRTTGKENRMAEMNRNVNVAENRKGRRFKD